MVVEEGSGPYVVYGRPDRGYRVDLGEIEAALPRTSTNKIDYRRLQAID
jgi:hypothetical protein